MTVVDISRGGLQLQLNQAPRFKIGDTIYVEFSLDDQLRTLIEKDVVVRKIDGNKIGTEFLTALHNSNPADKALGFYLFG